MHQVPFSLIQRAPLIGLVLFMFARLCLAGSCLTPSTAKTAHFDKLKLLLGMNDAPAQIVTKPSLSSG
jgi:hypothetical protein